MLKSIKNWQQKAKFKINVRIKQRVKQHADDDFKIIVEYQYVNKDNSEKGFSVHKSKVNILKSF